MNNQEKLFQLALKARKNAYTPYSKFKVGAAILSTNGNYYAGCNVENISFHGTCAEAGAVAAMIVDGDKKIAEILVLADSKNLVSPCGDCLQKISEFATAKTLVHLANPKNILKTLKVSELLPYAFNEDLKK